MARKAVLEGGKRDELVEAALGLFLAKGYEGVSVRMILDQVGGEVGMFYHYFKSKNEIFHAAVTLYLARYKDAFAKKLSAFDASTDIFEDLFSLLSQSLAAYGTLKHEGFHWSTQLALNHMTVMQIVPSLADLIGRLRAEKRIFPPASMNNSELASYLLFGARAILHESPNMELTKEVLGEKWQKVKAMTLLILCPNKKEI